MKKAVAALAVVCALLAGGLVYQSIPSSKSATVSAPQNRIASMLANIKAHKYKQPCDVLSYWVFNQGGTAIQCTGVVMPAQFANHVEYKLVGVEQPRKDYAVVTAKLAQDDPTTKVDEAAVCAKDWAAGADCKYEAVYSFGMVLRPSIEDYISAKKQAKQHWYVVWID